MKSLAMLCVKAPLLLLLVASSVVRVAGADKALSNQQTVDPAYLKPAGSRTFAIEYVAKLSGVPEGTKTLRVWVPVPQDSTVQTIRDLSFSQPAQLATEPKYGNKIAYWEINQPQSGAEIRMKFICTRREVVMDLARLSKEGTDPDTQFAVFKRADKLVTVDEDIRKLSRQITAGKQTTVEKARAIYEYVLGNMTYDKNHPGWGTGSTQHACDVGKGNCTDFHALFNSLCRAQGIASGFEIGLYLPYEKGKDEPLGGYHCWAFFRVPGDTWVPVDCSEADRFPERREFFFGGHTSNRVALSTGRDIVLAPAQAGEPLNYFLNPYGEADGKPVKAEKTWSYRDLE
jgi:transglutaminase-like putative cysteine protease